jgi:hypothetical protein
LVDALRSAQNQTHAPIEVIYVDDASGDGSPELARSLGGVRVLAPAAHNGVCHARNLGVAASKGEYVLHLDGDDILPSHYIEKQLATLKSNPRASYAYSPAQCFGGRNNLWPIPDWSMGRLWHSNYINTSSLAKKRDLLRAGGWQEGIGTAWDWDLWLRMGKMGMHGVPCREAQLLYRQHQDSITIAHGLSDGRGFDRPAIHRMNRLERLRQSRLTVCVIHSGRIPGFLDRLMHRLAECVESCVQTHMGTTPFGDFGCVNAFHVDLAILHTGYAHDRGWVDVTAQRHAHVFSNVSVMQERFDTSGLSEPDRQHAVATFLARSYNRMVDGPGELFWLVEDDVLPPDGCWKRAWAASTSNRSPRAGTGPATATRTSLPARSRAATPARSRR